MVCFVGLNNTLTRETKSALLEHVGLLKDGKFNVSALNQMLQYEDLKKQIRHYLGFRRDETRDIGQGFNDEYIDGELYDAVDKLDSPSASSRYQGTRSDGDMSDSSFDGGRSRRKHKKTRKRKPKSIKTRRKRSLLNRVKAWDR